MSRPSRSGPSAGTWLRRIIGAPRAILDRLHRSRERDLDDEIRAHMDMAVRDRMARGESPSDAERAVRREFGEPLRVKEATRRSWGGLWLDRLRQDVRFGVRSLRRDPGFAVTALLVLTVGIGANATIFTLAKGIFLDAPPAVGNPAELASVTWMFDDGVGEGWAFESVSEAVWAYPDYEFVRSRSAAFSGVLAYMPDLLPAAVASSGGATQADAWVVSDNFFQVLQSPMAVGRGFLPEEGQTFGSHPVVVLSHGFWDRHYGGDPSVVGSTLALNGRPFTVVGVANRDFRGLSPVEPPPDLYVPLMMQGALVAGAEEWFERVEGERSTWLRVVGRLAPEADLTAARTDMAAVQTRWEAAYGSWAAATNVPAFHFGVRSDFRFPAQQAERLEAMVGFLGVTVVALLLVGCANLAVLMLARAPARRSELGVRTALGAGRARVVRQLLTEGLLLSGLGAAGGLALSAWAASASSALMPYSFATDFRPDASIVGFAVVMAVLVTATFGMAPAIRASRWDVASILRRDRGGSERVLGRSVLVVAQVAVSVVLVAGAGLFVRSLLEARSIELGFEPAGAVAVGVFLENHGYDEPAAQAFVGSVLERARALPGVTAVSTTGRPPFSGRWSSTVRPEGLPDDDPAVGLYFNYAGPSYFDVLRTPVVAGRPMDARDVADAPPVMVVNETTADRLWPGENPIGRTIEWRERVWTVVGIAADASYYAIGDDPVTQVYVPPAQEFDSRVTFVLRGSLPDAQLASSLEAAIRDVDPAVAIAGSWPLSDLVAGQMSGYRTMAVLAGSAGAIALLLSAIGLAGLLAYMVSQSRREIGIRMALGSEAERVARQILGRGSGLAFCGLALGLACSLLLSRLVEGMLFGIDPRDPTTFALVASGLLVISFLASWLPARRAAGVDPMTVLRED